MPIAIGDHIARQPAPDGKDLVRHVLAHRFPEERLGVDLIRRIVIRSGDAETSRVRRDDVTPQPPGVT
jgi:hypothetical protein